MPVECSKRLWQDNMLGNSSDPSSYSYSIKICREYWTRSSLKWKNLVSRSSRRMASQPGPTSSVLRCNIRRLAYHNVHSYDSPWETYWEVIHISKRSVFCFKRKYNVRTKLWDTLYVSKARECHFMQVKSKKCQFCVRKSKARAKTTKTDVRKMVCVRRRTIIPI